MSARSGLLSESECGSANSCTVSPDSDCSASDLADCLEAVLEGCMGRFVLKGPNSGL